MKPLLARLVQDQRDGFRRISVAREYVQSRVLLSLQDAGAFTRWAFLGGTALRFLFDLPRYSEDLDFSLREPLPLRSGLASRGQSTCNSDATLHERTRSLRSGLVSLGPRMATSQRVVSPERPGSVGVEWPVGGRTDVALGGPVRPRCTRSYSI